MDLKDSKKIEIKCKQCGKIFVDYKSNKSKFCCYDCYYESKKGKIPWNKGLKGSQKAWNKGLKGYRAGEKHPWMAKGNEHYNWQGGKSFEEYGHDWTDLLKNSIRQRDSYICQECGTHQDELNRKLDVHHMDYNKKNCDPDNLVSLCRKCHLTTNYNREYWFNYFNNKINE